MSEYLSESKHSTIVTLICLLYLYIFLKKTEGVMNNECLINYLNMYKKVRMNLIGIF